MNIVRPEIEEYIAGFSTVNEPVIADMEAYGRGRGFPIVGPQAGALLMQLARVSGAKRILELGSGFGYSAAWFFLGTLTDGRIFCTEFSEENIQLGKTYLTRLGAVGNVEWRQGNALEILDTLGGPFDIIFNDIDKTGYPAAFDAALPKLRTGGMFIADNVLWKGKVADTEKDDVTQAIHEFNTRIFSTPSVISTILPVRDGLSISVKR